MKKRGDGAYWPAPTQPSPSCTAGHWTASEPMPTNGRASCASRRTTTNCRSTSRSWCTRNGPMRAPSSPTTDGGNTSGAQCAEGRRASPCSARPERASCATTSTSPIRSLRPESVSTAGKSEGRTLRWQKPSCDPIFPRTIRPCIWRRHWSGRRAPWRKTAWSGSCPTRARRRPVASWAQASPRHSRPRWSTWRPSAAEARRTSLRFPAPSSCGASPRQMA